MFVQVCVSNTAASRRRQGYSSFFFAFCSFSFYWWRWEALSLSVCFISPSLACYSISPSISLTTFFSPEPAVDSTFLSPLATLTVDAVKAGHTENHQRTEREREREQEREIERNILGDDSTSASWLL